MRSILTAMVPFVTLAVLSCGGGWIGFHLVGVPSGPHCGLAIIPALVFGGCFGGLLGLALGFIAGVGWVMLSESWLPSPLGEEDEEGFRSPNGS